MGAGEPVAAREPAVAAVRWLLDRGAQALIVVGDGPATGPVKAGTTGSFAGFGVPRLVTLGPARAEATEATRMTEATGTSEVPAPTLPLSLSVGAWLLSAAGVPRPGAPVVGGFTISADTSPEQAAGYGTRLGDVADRVAMLVMGDGSARRTPKAPGGFDERAEAFDASVATALAAGDPAGLLALDPALGRELLAAGRASWQVLAGAADAALTRMNAAKSDHLDGTQPADNADNQAPRPNSPSGLCRSVVNKPFRSYVTYDDAPYGVGYLVATWERGV
ncbi:MAG: hypothetical protein ACQSGP_29860 [Frankia sp.]